MTLADARGSDQSRDREGAFDSKYVTIFPNRSTKEWTLELKAMLAYIHAVQPSFLVRLNEKYGPDMMSRIQTGSDSVHAFAIPRERQNEENHKQDRATCHNQVAPLRRDERSEVAYDASQERCFFRPDRRRSRLGREANSARLLIGLSAALPDEEVHDGGVTQGTGHGELL